MAYRLCEKLFHRVASGVSLLLFSRNQLMPRSHSGEATCFCSRSMSCNHSQARNDLASAIRENTKRMIAGSQVEGDPCIEASFGWLKAQQSSIGDSFV
jgi:hypothetical protein